MTTKTPFKRLLQACLLLDGIYRDRSQRGGAKLGSYDESAGSITLYNVDNNPEELRLIEALLRETRVSFRLIIDQPGEKLTNLQLLDIDL